MEYRIPVGSILRCNSEVLLLSFTKGKRYVVLNSKFGSVLVKDDSNCRHTLTTKFISEYFELEYTGATLDLSPVEAKKLSGILKSARMLHLGDDMFIDELLEKLKGGNK